MAPALRLLTLVCFFNFSGLNNGFTYLVVSSGGVQKIDFTRALGIKAASLLNPSNWQDSFFSLRRAFLSKPARALEFASERAVGSFLSESILVHAWVAQSWQKWLSQPGPNSSPEALRNAGELAGAAVFAGPGAEEPASHEKLLSRRDSQSAAFLNGCPEDGIRALRQSFEASRREDLILDRHHFWNGHKDVGKPVLSSSHAGPIPVNSGGVLRHRLKCFARVLPEKLRSFLSSSISRNGSGDPISSNLRASVETPLNGLKRGSLFWGGLP